MDTLFTHLAVPLGIPNTVGLFLPLYLGATHILPTLLVLFDYFDRKAELANTVIKDPSFTYDFIIVGSGSAGSVVANRLSENYNVLLLERGGDPNPLTSVPGLVSILLNRPQTDYAYKTIPQNDSCRSMDNGQLLLSRGIGIGGSSVINQMIHLRGHPSDFDNWAAVTGDERWSYKNVLPSYLKSECYCYSCELGDPTSPTNSSYHAENGEYFLSKSSYSRLTQEFLDAMQWAEIPRVDLNAPFTKGADTILFNRKNGRRWTTRDAFIEPIRNRSNLHIVKYARVAKLNFEKEDSVHVNGVEYERFGVKHVAYASKEVILSAGAIETPKILLLSGIGPREQLESLGIPVKVVSPGTGKNFQDHSPVLLGPFLIDSPLSLNPERDLGPEAIGLFFGNHSGPWSVAGAHATAFFPSSRAIEAGESHWPDIQVTLVPLSVYSTFDEDLSKNTNIRLDVLKSFFNPVKGKDSFFYLVNFARPRSRGSVALRSSNFADDPLIDTGYFTDQNGTDMRVTVEAIKAVLNITENAPSFKKIGTKLSPTPLPPCKDLPFRSDSYWECFAREITSTYYHYSGTAAMGHKNSSHAVVDSELKVIGTAGLRVMDTSIFPFLTTTNSNAPTVMVAEKGSELVKESWKSKR